jgi:hypothetical protein
METALYLPVKRFLEARGFQVKGEICGCDLVALPVAPETPAANELAEAQPIAPLPLKQGARRKKKPNAANGADGESAPLVVIGELKQTFTLELLLQGVDRMAVGDEIWLAVRSTSKSKRRAAGRLNDRRVLKLCRLLGFGLLAVTAKGRVDILVEPTAYKPRGNPRRRSRLLREHQRRQGDPALGGGTRKPIMTAYRQQALTVAKALFDATQARPRDLKATAPDAPKILLHNVYGWFARVERGIYSLTDVGRDAVNRWALG